MYRSVQHQSKRNWWIADSKDNVSARGCRYVRFVTRWNGIVEKCERGVFAWLGRAPRQALLLLHFENMQHQQFNNHKQSNVLLTFFYLATKP